MWLQKAAEEKVLLPSVNLQSQAFETATQWQTGVFFRSSAVAGISASPSNSALEVQDARGDALHLALVVRHPEDPQPVRVAASFFRQEPSKNSIYFYKDWVNTSPHGPFNCLRF